MKKFVFLMLWLAWAVGAKADNEYSVTVGSFSAINGYTCTVAPLNIVTDAFADYDMITWIFPDGQYKQSIVRVDANNGNVLNNTNRVEWKPYKPISNMAISVYVTKKGGQGIPEKRIFFNQSLNATFTAVATEPETIDFPLGQNHRFSCSWEFAKGYETILIVSCKKVVGCPQGARLNINFNTSQLDYLGYMPFSNGNAAMNQSGKIEISFPDVSKDKHVYLRMRTKSEIGDTIKFNIEGSICGGPVITTSSFLTKGIPHDPNQKTVSIKKFSNKGITKLIYTVQFQNDGTAPVNQVLVSDLLPPELDPSQTSCKIVPSSLSMPGFIGPIDPINPKKEIKITGLNLPGLGQKNPSFSYDQTLCRFSFEVKTHANINANIDNKAEIFFYNGPIKLPPIVTNVATSTPFPVCTTLVNLVTNGNFMYGFDKSFKSGWAAQSANNCGNGGFCVGNQFRSKCSTWPANSFDHTLGNASGSMLLIDGYIGNTSEKNYLGVWQDTVCVEKDRIYTFSFWAKAAKATGSGSPPFKLGLSIDGKVENIVTIDQPKPEWKEYRVNWKASSDKCPIISILQMAPGNNVDFAIDDVFFGFCCASCNSGGPPPQK